MNLAFIKPAMDAVLARVQRATESARSRRRLGDLRLKLRSLGQNVEICSDLLVDYPERVDIGDWVYVGPEGRFYGRGGLAISDHTIIGPRVTIMTSMHNYKEASYVPYDEVELLGRVEVGVATWIGFGAILLPGVVLGQGCIVGAGSVVTRSFPDGSIIGGNPAQLIRTRDMTHFLRCLSEGKTYLKQKALLGLTKVERRLKPRPTREP